MFFKIFFIALSLVQSQVVICEAATANYFQYSKRTGGYDYVSQAVNLTYPSAYMDVEATAGITDEATIQKYITQPVDFQISPMVNFKFLCPGNSFLVGMLSNGFDPTKEYKFKTLGKDPRRLPFDRSYYFRCAFLDDPTGKPLKRGACTSPEVPDLLGVTTKTATCGNGAYFAGLNSSFNLKDGTYRTASSQCCALTDVAKKPFTLGACKEQVVDPQGAKAFSFSCPLNSILKTIKTEYLNTDYRYTFTCCTAFQ